MKLDNFETNYKIRNEIADRIKSNYKGIEIHKIKSDDYVSLIDFESKRHIMDISHQKSKLRIDILEAYVDTQLKYYIGSKTWKLKQCYNIEEYNEDIFKEIVKMFEASLGALLVELRRK